MKNSTVKLLLMSMILITIEFLCKDYIKLLIQKTDYDEKR